MRKLFLIAAAVLALPSRAHASEPLFDSPPLDDEELDQARGGFTLPGGIEIAFGAMIRTSVDGVPRLETAIHLTDNGFRGESVWHSEGGDAASAGTGSITIAPTGGATVTVSVETADLLIRHMIGSGITSIVANTADGRVIDTQVAIDLKLDNVPPLAVGSGGFQIEAMAVDAASFRAP